MSRFAETATDVLERHPAPAVSVVELHELLGRELPSSGVELLSPAVMVGLAREKKELRLLRAPRRRWIRPFDPPAWVVRDPAARDRGSPARSIPGRLRLTLRRFGRGVDPDSALAWARWNRLLEEERQIRRHLTRRGRRPGRLGSAHPS
jgi:hypothetical protein